MFYAHIGDSHWTKNILYLREVRPARHHVELLSGITTEDLNRIIKATGVQKLMFHRTDLPRRSVPVDHKKIEKFKQSFVWGCYRCPECGYFMKQVNRGATLRSHGASFVCLRIGNEKEHKYNNAWTEQQVIDRETDV